MRRCAVGALALHQRPQCVVDLVESSTHVLVIQAEELANLARAALPEKIIQLAVIYPASGKYALSASVCCRESGIPNARHMDSNKLGQLHL